MLEKEDKIIIFAKKTLNSALKINTTFKKTSEFTVLIWMKKT